MIRHRPTTMSIAFARYYMAQADKILSNPKAVDLDDARDRAVNKQEFDRAFQIWVEADRYLREAGVA